MRLVLIIALVLLTGCRKSAETSDDGDNAASIRQKGDTIEIRTADGTARIDAEGGTARIETNEGTMTFGETEIPEGFPLPVRAGATVVHGAHMTGPDGAEVYQLTYNAPGTVKEIADFYEKTFKDRGVEVTRTEQTGGGSVMVILGGGSDEVDANAMIVKEGDDEQPTITVSWSKRRKE